MKAIPPQKYSLWSAYLGNIFEHYDTALFGFLAPFLAPLIFPQHDSLIALIFTYAMIPIGMIARPIGALFFGYLGDKHDRETALYVSMGGMGLLSFCIALSPTYTQVGWLSPLLFCISRVFQNFLSAGESMGGAIFLLEKTSEKKHDLFSGIYGATTLAGILLASIGVSLISYFNIMDWGWRVLYLLGSITALFGFIIRENTTLPAKTNPTSFSLSLIFTQWKPLLMIAICSGFSYANYTIALVLMNGFIPLVSPISHEEMASMNTLLLLLDFLALPLFGWLASKTSREKMMLFASSSVVLTTIPLFLLLPHASLFGIAFIRVCLVLFGVAFFAPFHAWAQELVYPSYRYGVISFGYAIGSQLLGGPTAAISLWAFKTTGSVTSVAYYWLVLGMLSTWVLGWNFLKKGFGKRVTASPTS